MEQLSLIASERLPDMPFAQFIDWYFAHYAENGLKASTWENYEYIATTANLYTEVLDSTKAEAAKSVAVMLGE